MLVEKEVNACNEIALFHLRKPLDYATPVRDESLGDYVTNYLSNNYLPIRFRSLYACSRWEVKLHLSYLNLGVLLFEIGAPSARVYISISANYM